ncbi:unnamed protein product [Caretta caretta]
MCQILKSLCWQNSSEGVSGVLIVLRVNMGLQLNLKFLDLARLGRLKYPSPPSARQPRVISTYVHLPLSTGPLVYRRIRVQLVNALSATLGLPSVLWKCNGGWVMLHINQLRNNSIVSA